MPPLPQIHLHPLREATRLALGESADNTRAILSAAFDVARDIDAEQEYPTEWLIFRLKLPASTQKARQASGAELLADLAAMVEHLSDAARLSRTAQHDTWHMLDDLAQLWSVSRKTIDRYRKRGLLAWRIRDDKGKPVLLVEPRHALAFASRHALLIQRAAGFERIDTVTQARMLRRAAVYREHFGCTLNQVADRLATRFGRSREAVRVILRRADGERTRAGASRFTEPLPLSDRDCRVCMRAVQRGIDPALMARRFRKPMGSIRRAVGVAQWKSLQPYHAALITLDDGTWSDAEIDAALASPPAQTGLHVRGITDLADFLEDAAGPYSMLAIEETTRMAAYRAARMKATRQMSRINHNFPATTELDEIITLLRWASRLKVWLMRSQFRVSVQTLESTFGAPLTGLKSADGLAIAHEIVTTLSDLVDQHAKGEARGRLAAPVGLAMNRVAGKWMKERLRPSSGKASPRATARPHGTLPDWTTRVSPWQPTVDAPLWLRQVLPGLSAHARELLTLRFGWDGLGSPPRTLECCMSTLGWSRIRAVRQERKAMREALTIVRNSGAPS
ncbi:MAG: hypothetical protein KGS45_08600 [Planctomycetes bacterium]|nr:hypothetical protein [Planctomycetota bacterium]